MPGCRLGPDEEALRRDGWVVALGLDPCTVGGYAPPPANPDVKPNTRWEPQQCGGWVVLQTV
jgi:hypothetical protein